MEFLEVDVDNKKDWNDFVVSNSPESFLQSFEWGEFQQAAGRKVHRFAAEEDGHIRAVALAIEHALPFGLRYWYIPRGPVVEKGLGGARGKEMLDYFISGLKRAARNGGTVFIRMDPAIEKEAINDFLMIGAKHAPGSVQPKDTLVLDIDKSEEDILAQMKQKTRYNIRLAEKKGVEVRVSGGSREDLDAFWGLIEETSERDGIVSHGREHYDRMLSTLSADDGALRSRLYLARHEGKPVAANIVLLFGEYAVYLHGASSNEMRNLMAPYLLQWRQIQDAKRSGCRIYDFWGITIDNERPRWAGITRFKQGFGGREIGYAGLFDLPVQKGVYAAYSWAQRIRGKR